MRCEQGTSKKNGIEGKRKKEDRKREETKVLDELITGIGHGITHEFVTYLRANESERGKPTTRALTFGFLSFFRHLYITMYDRKN